MKSKVLSLLSCKYLQPAIERRKMSEEKPVNKPGFANDGWQPVNKGHQPTSRPNQQNNGYQPPSQTQQTQQVSPPPKKR